MGQTLEITRPILIFANEGRFVSNVKNTMIPLAKNGIEVASDWENTQKILSRLNSDLVYLALIGNFARSLADDPESIQIVKYIHNVNRANYVVSRHPGSDHLLSSAELLTHPPTLCKIIYQINQTTMRLK
jgi:hypothetical protein